MFDENFFLIIGSIFVALYFSEKTNKEKFNQEGGGMLNIYDEELQPCDEGNMGNGSWDSQGKCSEKGGGIHQICFKKLGTNANNFSKNTGQDNWSVNRGSNNHCLCLGAWSLYVAKKNRGKIIDNNVNQLKCDAIPKISLSEDYVGKFQGWDKWNQIELDGQIKDGVEELVQSCYYQGNTKQKKSLRNNYCNFARKNNVLKNSNMFSNFCI